VNDVWQSNFNSGFLAQWSSSNGLLPDGIGHLQLGKKLREKRTGKVTMLKIKSADRWFRSVFLIFKMKPPKIELAEFRK